MFPSHPSNGTTKLTPTDVEIGGSPALKTLNKATTHRGRRLKTTSIVHTHGSETQERQQINPVFVVSINIVYLTTTDLNDGGSLLFVCWPCSVGSEQHMGWPDRHPVGRFM